MSSLPVIPLLLLVAGAWLLGWGVRRRGAAGAMPDGWQRVAGTVVDPGDGTSRPPRIEYRTPDGRRLRVPGPMTTRFTADEQVDVLIDPRDASRVRLDVTERDAARLVVLLIGTGAILLLLGIVTAIAFL